MIGYLPSTWLYTKEKILNVGIGRFGYQTMSSIQDVESKIL
jgi:hypothetical protein